MNYLIDANLVPRVVVAAGHDASHVGDHGLLTATDDEIFDWATDNGSAVVTADSDFAMPLAARRTKHRPWCNSATSPTHHQRFTPDS